MMKLQMLRVIHLPKTREVPSLLGLPASFEISTCLRQVKVFSSRRSNLSTHIPGMDVLEGVEAYRFLLRWACGLESQILGETDIFGQIKQSWQAALRFKTPEIMELSPWMQRLFEDTKEIRAQYLENLGGSSYGTLVRKWIRGPVCCGSTTGPTGKSSGSILIVGAGQIARSIAPALGQDSELLVWNRDPARLESFYQDLAPRVPHGRLICTDEEETGWKKAAHIVVCIPKDLQGDAQRIQWLGQRSREEGGKGLGVSFPSVIHLGLRRHESGVWGSIPGFACLDDLFALQDSIGNYRSIQVAQAERACEERAKLRSLGASLSIPHGWEDLACFASV